jgi:hypothetical protein
MEKVKNDSYAVQLDAARHHASVLCGMRVINFKACAFTSLGEYGKPQLSLSMLRPGSSSNVLWPMHAVHHAMMGSHRRSSLPAFGPRCEPNCKSRL